MPSSDDDRPIDYVGVQMQPEHVLASSAIPVLFPAVRVQEPSGTGRWFLDGGLRLNAPLKPALSLDADCLVVVATHPIRDNTTTPEPNPLPPDVDDILVQLLDIVLVDRMVEDLRTLNKINALVPDKAVTATGRLRRKVPYLFVGRQYRETLGHLAIDILHHHRRHSGDLLHRLRQLELDLMRHLLEGDGPRRGDLLSFPVFRSGIHPGIHRTRPARCPSIVQRIPSRRSTLAKRVITAVSAPGASRPSGPAAR